MENNLLNKRDYQKQYRVVGICIFSMSILVLCARILSYYISGLFSGLEQYLSDFAIDTIFTLLVQVVILFVMPLLLYKFLLKKSVKDVFKFSGFKKTKPINLLLALAIGILGIIVTIGISLAWQIILIIFGYIPPSSSAALPDNFNIWLFLGSMFLTAVLPGFCEEFTMRGGFLTVLRSALPITSVIMVSAMAFGLFHQYIIQTFYTACFGGLMAYVTIRSKSIFPAMVIHFTNNGLSVYLEFAEKYNWVGGGFYSYLDNMLFSGNIGTLFFAYIAIFIAFALLIYLFSRINPKEIQKPVMLSGDGLSSPVPSGILLSSGANLDNYTVKRAPPLELDRKIAPRQFAYSYANIYGGTMPTTERRIVFINNRYYLIENNILFALKPKLQFKPSLRDNAYFISAIVVTTLSTIFTFVWGLMI